LETNPEAGFQTRLIIYMRLRFSLLLCSAMLLAGCGSTSNNTSNSSSSAPDVLSGNWQMSLLPTGKTLAKTQSGFLVQTGNNVTGRVMVLDSPCSGVGDVSGTIDGTGVSLSVSPTELDIVLTGSVGSDQKSMSGNFTLQQNGCSGTSSAPLSGTWTADLVAPLNGKIQGTFTSKEGVTYPVAGQISQGPNTGTSTAILTGNFTVSGYCFFGAGFTGTVSGTALVLNLLNPDGSQAGQMTGSNSTDGTSISGKYNISAEGDTPPCKGGDGGTFSFSL
jgi:hypothetical protein